MSHWSLFVDETGNFRFDPERWVVAGVLFPSSHGELRHPLRAIIDTQMPDLPYPPHATDLRIEGAHAAYTLAWELARENQPYPDKQLHEAANQIRANQRQAWGARILEAVQRNGTPSQEDLRLLNRACSGPVRGRLGLRANEMLAAARQVLQAAAALSGVAVAAAVDRARLKEPEEPYLDLLGILLERVMALLVSQAGDTPIELDVDVSKRKVGPENDLRWLKREDVLDLLAAARAAQRRPERIQLGTTLMSDGKSRGVHAGIVLSDFVANFSSSVVAQTSWKALEEQAGTSFKLPVRLYCAELTALLPTLAASGPASEAIRAGAGASPLEDGWPADQAREWIAALSQERPA